MADHARRIGFLLTQGYALLSTSAAIEPLRAANQLAGRTLYDMRFLSLSGGALRASAGGYFDTVPVAEGDCELVFVVAGGNPMTAPLSPLDRHLRQLDGRRVALGGISGGAVLLARAGLMANRRFTVHWEHVDALREHDPELLLERRLFVIDRDRYTCAGGAAPLDMMHALIAADHGADLARAVSDWFIHTQVRLSGDPQRAGLAEKHNAHNPALLAAIELMDSHVADPLSLEQLAQLTGQGGRNLQRLFSDHLGKSVMSFYRDLRLDKAEELLRQSALPVTEVGLATGFENPSHFARVFQQRYGQSPRAWRRKG